MFAKAAVFFFALIAFVHAAPIVGIKGDLNIGVGPNKMVLPDVTYNKLVASKRDISLEDLVNELGNFVDSLDLDDTHFNAAAPLPKRAIRLWGNLIDNFRELSKIINKRDTVDLDSLGSQILDGLKSHGLTEYVDHFSTRIQRLKDLLSSDVSRTQITAEARNLLLEYRQVLAGLNVNKPVKARDTGNSLSDLDKFLGAQHAADGQQAGRD